MSTLTVVVICIVAFVPFIFAVYAIFNPCLIGRHEWRYKSFMNEPSTRKCLFCTHKQQFDNDRLKWKKL